MLLMLDCYEYEKPSQRITFMEEYEMIDIDDLMIIKNKLNKPSLIKCKRLYRSLSCTNSKSQIFSEINLSTIIKDIADEMINVKKKPRK